MIDIHVSIALQFASSGICAMKNNAIVYWLLPQKAERELFCEMIRILCHELDAPNFEPHLTLFVSNSSQPPARVLRKLKSGPIRLRIHRVAFSPEYTKTLFIRFKPSKPLHKLILELGCASDTRVTAPRDRHLSLLYKRRISSATEKELAATIKLPFRVVRFDRVAAVRVNLPIQNRGDIKAWKILATKTLRSNR